MLGLIGWNNAVHVPFAPFVARFRSGAFGAFLARFANFEPLDDFGLWPVWPVCGPFEIGLTCGPFGPFMAR